MILLSVVLAYFQERRSGRAVEKLQEMVQTNCIVIRDGKEEKFPQSGHRARRLEVVSFRPGRSFRQICGW